MYQRRIIRTYLLGSDDLHFFITETRAAHTAARAFFVVPAAQATAENQLVRLAWLPIVFRCGLDLRTGGNFRGFALAVDMEHHLPIAAAAT